MPPVPLLILILAVVAFYPPTAVFGFSAPSSKSTHASDPVRVWDNVIPPSDLPHLHSSAKLSGLGHRVFTRPIHKNASLIEKALDSVLTELEEETFTGKKQFVEYWSRREWRHIEAHADIDEMKARTEEGAFRYPEYGHVLYLQVGSEVRGPTCIFPRRSSGGDLLRPPVCESSEDNGNDVELITVPAVPGRLLRFKGDALHAVPRPADLWLLSFVKGAPRFDPEEEWGRSVVLFNTWPGGEPPPKDVPLDEYCGEEEGLVVRSNPRSAWKDIWPDGEYQGNGNAKDDVPMRSAKVWLLGDYRRRDHAMRTVKLFAPEEHIRKALTDTHQVQRTILKQE